MIDINEVAENIYLIDDQLYSIPKLGCVYLLNEEKKALIDSGPATSANAVIDGIKKVGVRPEDIAYIIITHIHLDHVGGVGILLKDMPQAQVIVHYKSAKHLVNPTKLVSNAMEVQGKEAMLRLGEVLPVEPHRVQAIHDGDTIKLSDKQVLEFIGISGHAPHELCIHENRNKGLFVGDAIGIYINEILLPVPNVNPELCINTLRRLMELNVTTIYLPHFGTCNKVQENLQLAIDNLKVWDDIVAKAIGEDALDQAAGRLVAHACARLEPIKQMESLYGYIANVLIPLAAASHVKYFQEKRRAQ